LKKHKALLTLLGLVLIVSTSFGQVAVSGGKGLYRILDAESIYPGILYINPFYSGYGSDNEGKFSEDHTLNLSFTLGLSRKMEIYLNTVPYQDDQEHIWGPFGDTKIGVKYSFQSKERFTKFGLAGFATLPTAPRHNVDFEPFTSDKIGWGVLGLLNFDLKNNSSAIPLKFSLNFGYRDLDVKDRFFQDKKDQLVGGLGLKFPVRSSIIYSEFYSETFYNNSDVSLSYNFVRFTQGIRFLGPWNLVFDIAGDIELGGYSEKDNGPSGNPFIKDYADWKVVVGMTYRTQMFKYLTPEEKLARKYQKEEQEKLESIRQKREQVIKDLEDIKKKLDKEKRDKDAY